MRHSIFCLLFCGLFSLYLPAQTPAIFVPKPTSEQDGRAARMLQFYLEKMMGQSVPIISKSTVPKNVQPIYVGHCNVAKKYGIDMPGELPQDAFFLAGKNGAFAIQGGGDMGAEYGVYTFLELLGCRKYSPRDSFIPEIKNLLLPVYPARIVTPAFPYRELWYEPAFDEAWARWHKLKTNPKKNEEWGMFVHTFDKLCPKEKYFSGHPEYFAFNGAQHSPGQLCLSNDTVLQIVTANLRELLREKPAAKYWSLSQNDNYDYCKCPRCAAADRYYGSPAGTLLAFVNRVADTFPDITLSTLAYQYTRQAPKNIRPARNVSVCLCSIECNRGQSIEDGCQDFARDVREWSQLTDNLMIWDYVVQFRSYISPFPNWHTLQPNLQFFQKNGVKMMFEQGSGHDRSEFSDMRAYLLAKLMWNPQANKDSILTDFGNAYYGAARPAIWQYIHDQTTRLAKHGNKLWIYDIPQNEPFVNDSFFFRFNSITLPEADSSHQLRYKSVLLVELFAFLENLKTVPYNMEDPLSETVTMLLRNTTLVQDMLSGFVQICHEAGFKHLNENGYTPEQYLQDYKAYIKKALEAQESKATAVTLTNAASPTYAKGDPLELTNKLIGETDYRCNWLGFEGKDLQATVKVQGETASSIEVSFLQDQASWVFLPEKVILEISADGLHFQTVHEAKIELVPDGKKAVRSISTIFLSQPVRFVRVTAISPKTCPAWHTCNGNACWIFADEVMVR
jgi:hypothetical protein